MRKQAQMTMRCMQALVRVQARVRASRLQLSHDKVQDNTCIEDKLGTIDQKMKSTIKKNERHQRRQSFEKIKENVSEKHDAIMKRERDLAYAFACQVSVNKVYKNIITCF